MIEAIILSLCMNYTCQVTDYGDWNDTGIRNMMVKTTKVERQYIIELLAPSVEPTGEDTVVLVVPIR